MEVVLAFFVGAIVGKWLTANRYREERAREGRAQWEAAMENQRQMMASPFRADPFAGYHKPDPVRLLTWEPRQ